MWITGQLLVILNLLLVRELNTAETTLSEATFGKIKSSMLTLFKVYAKFVKTDTGDLKYPQDFQSLQNLQFSCATMDLLNGYGESLYSYYSQTLHLQGGYTKQVNQALLNAINTYFNSMSSTAVNGSFLLKDILTAVKESLKKWLS